MEIVDVRLVLNKNIDNFFAENEQLAFCPAIVVPGIHSSDDKLLQTRVFSYAGAKLLDAGGECATIITTTRGL